MARILLALSLAALIGCQASVAPSPPTTTATTTAAAPAATAAAGSFKLLTYNVAGLPDTIARRKSSTRMPLIAPLLDAYDLVLVQEDFAYPELLRGGTAHLFRTEPVSGRGFGDGLSRFSRFAIRDHERTAWASCHGLASHGSDCLASKGFDVATHELAPGVKVDVYNLHLDAGRSIDDHRARASQIDQLATAIATRSNDRAVIVAGDTNLWGEDNDLMAALRRIAGLVDACSALSCSDGWRIDRVLYRAGGGVTLTPRSWSIRSEFVDGNGRPLSDHRAIAVEFDWTTSTITSAARSSSGSPSPR